MPPYVNAPICWGHQTGITEVYDTFASNWTGTGAITGAVDAERLELNAGEYMESDLVITAITHIQLTKNKYQAGDPVLMRYRTGATDAACLLAAWTDYTVPFDSLGYVQIRVESTL